jgi:thioredoxin 1
MTVQTLTDASFDAAIAEASVPVLIDFWAEWCAPCVALEPVIEEISNLRDGSLTVARVNTVEQPETAAKFGVTSIPTLLIVKDGEVVKRIPGARPMRALLAAVDAVIGE